MTSVNVSVAKDFSRFPGPRFVRQGKNSGEKFRDDLLLPQLEAGRTVVVDLDGTLGYGSSFIEEAFGGLLRRGQTAEALRHRLIVKTSDASLLEEIVGYIEDAAVA